MVVKTGMNTPDMGVRISIQESLSATRSRNQRYPCDNEL